MPAPGEVVRLVVEGEAVAVWNVDGRLHALGDVCPHRGFILSEGVLERRDDRICVVCPGHHWRYDLLTGEHTAGPERLPVYDVVVVGDTIEVGAGQPGAGTEADRLQVGFGVVPAVPPDAPPDIPLDTPMPATADDLIESISGAKILAPDELAAAIVEAKRDGRLGDVVTALSSRPGPKMPPRYESEIRTWLSRSGVDADASQARLQGYAAVHLDPHNREAIAALDAACSGLGEGVRRDTWEALMHSYPDVVPVSDAAAEAGVVLPDAAAVERARRRVRARTDAFPTDAPRRDRAEVKAKAKPKKRAVRVEGIASLVPALEPDPVKSDRLAAIHLVSGNTWRPRDGRLDTDESDPLTWAVRHLNGSPAPPPESAVATAAVTTLRAGEPDEDGNPDPGPRYGRVLKRLKGHPAAVVWAARRQVDGGDIAGAQKARARMEGGEAALWADQLAPIDAILAVAGGDVEAGWSQWEAGSLPAALRAPLARGLLDAGRDSDADEVLGLPEVPAARIDDAALVQLRFDVLFKEADVSEALAQAERLVELAPTKTASIGRLWLAYAADGRLAALASRVGADAAACGQEPSRIVASVRPELEARVRRSTEAIAAAVAAARTDLQQLAKGRTIRTPEAFDEAAARARSALSDVEKRFAAAAAVLAGDGGGVADRADEDLLALVAAARGWIAQFSGGRLVLHEQDVDPAVAADPVVEALTAPAREIGTRAGEFAAAAREAGVDLDAAIAESQRDDLARRRVEERVSKLARNAADALSGVVTALSPGRTPDEGDTP